ncbi:hypothetical protein BUALT_Bualt13G0035400 [Buddleja alternifolia]|uniref:GAG-pre-integrase domain-containing protein n=1 Tax=Buddleja alternifolia TaxID=168488 RepID=A0AAV6WSZ3_9LAMI|nr:hypothetical protein BUALT_Bualt13G0035400 [Buddleja alternifolia]
MDEVIEEEEATIHNQTKKRRTKTLMKEEAVAEEKNILAGSSLEEGNPTMLLACKSPKHEDKNQWYLDSGASSHICGKSNLFMELDESISGNITFRDSSQVQVKGKGTILICLKDGSHQFISNVFYVPEMKINILSLGQLLEKNYDIHLKNKSLIMRNESGRLLAKVPMTRNRMFMLNIQSDVPRRLQACVKNSSWLWQMRFGHLNFDGLKEMKKKGMMKRWCHQLLDLQHQRHKTHPLENQVPGPEEQKVFVSCMKRLKRYLKI